jgi:hypothetical protein
VNPSVCVRLLLTCIAPITALVVRLDMLFAILYDTTVTPSGNCRLFVYTEWYAKWTLYFGSLECLKKRIIFFSFMLSILIGMWDHLLSSDAFPVSWGYLLGL